MKQPARAPLGGLYQGVCEIGGLPGLDAARLDACNFGYSAGRCDVFPLGAEADAARFTVLEGKTIFVLEKGCSPVRHGDAASLEGALARQAEVFQLWMNR